VQDDQADRARARAPELIEWLERMVDADTLEELRADYRRFKDRASERAAAVSQDATWRERDWTVWDGEKPVACNEVADAPPDTYELEGGSFEAVDLYFMRPGCDSEDVEVDFFRAGDDEARDLVGAGGRFGSGAADGVRAAHVAGLRRVTGRRRREVPRPAPARSSPRTA
jgi:hypothetical protein